MLEIVLPFGLPPDELAQDLIKALQTPALAKLLAGASIGEVRHFEAFSSRLPDEFWLAQRLGEHTQNAVGAMHRWKVAPNPPLEPGYWFILNPIHLHIARDHLVLTSPRQLHLTEDEAQALFACASPYFEEAALSLLYATPSQWFLRADAWADLQTSSINAACGHNVDIWMPKGSAARAWRKLQNEIQMAWFAHPVNQAREARGALPVNSIWLSGGAKLPQVIPPSTPVFRSDWNGTPSDLPEDSILYADSLIEPALAGDWAAWLQEMQELDRNWFNPLMKKGLRHRPLHLIFTHSHTLRQFSCNTFNKYLFWRRPKLSGLLPS